MKFITRKNFRKFLEDHPDTTYVRDDSARCPLAIAMRTTTGDDTINIRIGEWENRKWEDKLPVWAEKFRDAFDYFHIILLEDDIVWDEIPASVALEVFDKI